ncbi:leucine-rich repeat transmembrane protein kinase [Artemisia annua]|uniref:Leucine-rich repeat transmembrane protein kinase n=1 Tax=Artemisia annua TaxID=35608 RepID=A0A2U1LN29_ARTAN|nr:leucine-rich repeat transmembrane protein kinase [Artemisia annua]
MFINLSYLTTLIFTFTFTTFTTSQNPETQTLITFKNTLQNTNNVLNSWDPKTLNHCHWEGVTCNDQNLVTILNLSQKSLLGTNINTLYNLKHLIILDLSSNLFSGHISPEISNLRRLKILNLNQNQFSGEIPPELGLLTELQSLDLSSNSLAGEIPPEIGKLTKLRSLGFGNNFLNGTINGNDPKNSGIDLKALFPVMLSFTKLRDIQIRLQPWWLKNTSRIWKRLGEQIPAPFDFSTAPPTGMSAPRSTIIYFERTKQSGEHTEALPASFSRQLPTEDPISELQTKQGITYSALGTEPETDYLTLQNQKSATSTIAEDSSSLISLGIPAPPAVEKPRLPETITPRTGSRIFTPPICSTHFSATIDRKHRLFPQPRPDTEQPVRRSTHLHRRDAGPAAARTHTESNRHRE